MITCTVGMGTGKFLWGWDEITGMRWGWGKIYRTGAGRGKIHGNGGRGRLVLHRYSLQPVANNCCNFPGISVEWSQTEVCIIRESKSTTDLWGKLAVRWIFVISAHGENTAVWTYSEHQTTHSDGHMEENHTRQQHLLIMQSHNTAFHNVVRKSYHCSCFGENGFQPNLWQRPNKKCQNAYSGVIN